MLRNSRRWKEVAEEKNKKEGRKRRDKKRKKDESKKQGKWKVGAANIKTRKKGKEQKETRENGR